MMLSQRQADAEGQAAAPSSKPPEKFPEVRWTPEMISRFWDWQSQYPEVYFTYLFGREIAHALRGFLAGKQRVLDFGCGVGYLLPHLCQFAPKVYGADPSPDSVRRTNERLAGMKGFEGAFLVSDLQKHAAVFDAILVVEVIEHLYDDELDAALHTIRSMLSPDGIVIFTTPNNENRDVNMILCPATGEVFHRWQHVRSWNAESVGRWLRANQFEMVQAIETNFSLRRPRNVSELLKKIVKRLAFGHPGNPHLICVAKPARTERA
jgi:2-polyprenyl-3-methyl-5-hydroxy-6-metoxy-1,4-benzoquinol methylase